MKILINSCLLSICGMFLMLNVAAATPRTQPSSTFTPLLARFDKPIVLAARAHGGGGGGGHRMGSGGGHRMHGGGGHRMHGGGGPRVRTVGPRYRGGGPQVRTSGPRVQHRMDGRRHAVTPRHRATYPTTRHRYDRRNVRYQRGVRHPRYRYYNHHRGFYSGRTYRPRYYRGRYYYNNLPAYILFGGLGYGLSWIWATGGYIPSNAIYTDYGYGYPVYVCRAYYRGHYYTGRLYEGRGCIINYYGDEIILRRYRVLVR